MRHLVAMVISAVQVSEISETAGGGGLVSRMHLTKLEFVQDTGVNRHALTKQTK